MQTRRQRAIEEGRLPQNVATGEDRVRVEATRRRTQTRRDTTVPRNTSVSRARTRSRATRLPLRIDHDVEKRCPKHYRRCLSKACVLKTEMYAPRPGRNGRRARCPRTMRRCGDQCFPKTYNRKPNKRTRNRLPAQPEVQNNVRFREPEEEEREALPVRAPPARTRRRMSPPVTESRHSMRLRSHGPAE